ncbi:DsrE family protein [Kitasatospora sp. NA04385]|uniref:DsrE family protein n=1 Tax=Kitasatospora sp. NA04385 TaxID=2742135 RepID=UPI0011633852|nr:DsrE family protein [Kitasatospora sp. NA04385]QDJ74271.1 DsrE/DsrF-like family protein [Kitasatospora sp.]QKW22404.1 DsrE family protein [Kitasatospora sp. NA04385]
MSTNAAALRYLLVESRSASHGAALAFLRDAAVQSGEGHDVTLFLVQDAVSLALGGTPEIDGFLAAGGRLTVDRFSLDQRGIRPDAVLAAAAPVGMEDVAELVLDRDVRVVWH